MRVGWRGLIAEGLGSLAVTGALPRPLTLMAMLLAVGAWVHRGLPVVRLVLLAPAAGPTVLAPWIGCRTARALADVRMPEAKD